MKRFIFSFVTALLITTGTGDLYADSVNEAKQADIVKLMEITGVLSLGKQMSDSIVTQMTRVIKASRPELDPKLFDILREEVNSVIEENLPKFTAQLIPVYDKYFTHQDIKEMIQFYQTALGQKTIQVMPLLLQESMSLGRQWGQALGPEVHKRVIERFKAEGVDLQV